MTDVARAVPDITQDDVHGFALAHGSDEALCPSHAWDNAQVDLWLQAKHYFSSSLQQALTLPPGTEGVDPTLSHNSAPDQG